MKRVADQHGKGAALVHFTIVGMAVAPEDELFKNEEKKDSSEKRAEDL